MFRNASFRHKLKLSYLPQIIQEIATFNKHMLKIAERK